MNVTHTGPCDTFVRVSLRYRCRPAVLRRTIGSPASHPGSSRARADMTSGQWQRRLGCMPDLDAVQQIRRAAGRDQFHNCVLWNAASLVLPRSSDPSSMPAEIPWACASAPVPSPFPGNACRQQSKAQFSTRKRAPGVHRSGSTPASNIFRRCTALRAPIVVLNATARSTSWTRVLFSFFRLKPCTCQIWRPMIRLASWAIPVSPATTPAAEIGLHNLSRVLSVTVTGRFARPA